MSDFRIPVADLDPYWWIKTHCIVDSCWLNLHCWWQRQQSSHFLLLILPTSMKSTSLWLKKINSSLSLQSWFFAEISMAKAYVHISENPHLNWCLSKSPKNRSTYFFNWLWWRDELPLNPRGLLLEKKDTSLRNFTRTKTLQNTSPALAQASDGQLFQAHVHTQYLRGPVKWLFQAWALFWTKI